MGNVSDTMNDKVNFGELAEQLVTNTNQVIDDLRRTGQEISTVAETMVNNPAWTSVIAESVKHQVFDATWRGFSYKQASFAPNIAFCYQNYPLEERSRGFYKREVSKKEVTLITYKYGDEILIGKGEVHYAKTLPGLYEMSKRGASLIYIIFTKEYLHVVNVICHNHVVTLMEDNHEKRKIKSYFKHRGSVAPSTLVALTLEEFFRNLVTKAMLLEHIEGLLPEHKSIIINNITRRWFIKRRRGLPFIAPFNEAEFGIPHPDQEIEKGMLPVDCKMNTYVKNQVDLKIFRPDRASIMSYSNVDLDPESIYVRGKTQWLIDQCIFDGCNHLQWLYPDTFWGYDHHFGFIEMKNKENHCRVINYFDKRRLLRCIVKGDGLRRTYLGLTKKTPLSELIVSQKVTFEKFLYVESQIVGGHRDVSHSWEPMHNAKQITRNFVRFKRLRCSDEGYYFVNVRNENDISVKSKLKFWQEDITRYGDVEKNPGPDLYVYYDYDSKILYMSIDRPIENSYKITASKERLSLIMHALDRMSALGYLDLDKRIGQDRGREIGKLMFTAKGYSLPPSIVEGMQNPRYMNTMQDKKFWMGLSLFIKSDSRLCNNVFRHLKNTRDRRLRLDAVPQSMDFFWSGLSFIAGSIIGILTLAVQLILYVGAAPVRILSHYIFNSETITKIKDMFSDIKQRFVEWFGLAMMAIKSFFFVVLSFIKNTFWKIASSLTEVAKGIADYFGWKFNSLQTERLEEKLFNVKFKEIHDDPDAFMEKYCTPFVPNDYDTSYQFVIMNGDEDYDKFKYRVTTMPMGELTHNELFRNLFLYSNYCMSHGKGFELDDTFISESWIFPTVPEAGNSALALGTVISGAFASMFTDSKKGVLQNTNDVLRVATSSGKIVSDIWNCICPFVSVCMYKMTNCEFFIGGKHITEYRSILCRVNSFMDEVKGNIDSLRLKIEYCTRVLDLYHELNVIYIKAIKEGWEKDMVMTLARVEYQLRHWSAVASARLDAGHDRHRPLIIYLVGRPGQGKSTINQILSRTIYQMAASQKPNSFRFARAYSPSDHTYSKAMGSEYWDQYAGNFTCFVNEFGAYANQDKRGVDAAEVLRMGEDSDYVLNMAAVEAKGIARFNSSVVILDSNFYDFARMGLTNPDAFLRRLDFVCEVERATDVTFHRDMSEEDYMKAVEGAWNIRLVSKLQTHDVTYKRPWQDGSVVNTMQLANMATQLLLDRMDEERSCDIGQKHDMGKHFVPRAKAPINGEPEGFTDVVRNWWYPKPNPVFRHEAWKDIPEFGMMVAFYAVSTMPDRGEVISIIEDLHTRLMDWKIRCDTAMMIENVFYSRSDEEYFDSVYPPITAHKALILYKLLTKLQDDVDFDITGVPRYLSAVLSDSDFEYCVQVCRYRASTAGDIGINVSTFTSTAIIGAVMAGLGALAAAGCMHWMQSKQKLEANPEFNPNYDSEKVKVHMAEKNDPKGKKKVKDFKEGQGLDIGTIENNLFSDYAASYIQVKFIEEDMVHGPYWTFAPGGRNLVICSHYVFGDIGKPLNYSAVLLDFDRSGSFSTMIRNTNYKLVQLEGRDLCLMKFDLGMREFVSKRKRFVKKGTEIGTAIIRPRYFSPTSRMVNLLVVHHHKEAATMYSGKFNELDVVTVHMEHYAGLCMAPYYNKQGQILGFHVCGSGTLSAFARIFEEDLPKIYEPYYPSVVEKDIVWQPQMSEGALRVVGTVQHHMSGPGKTTLQESCIYHLVVNDDWCNELEKQPCVAPCILRKRGEVDPKRNALAKYTKMNFPMNWTSLFDMTKEVVKSPETYEVPFVRRGRITIRSARDVIMGIAGEVQSVDQTTSVGWKWKLYKISDRNKLFNLQTGWINPLLLADVEYVISEMRQGRYPFNCCIATLKDETRSIDKIEKPRLFCNSDFTLLIVAKMYFYDLFELWKSKTDHANMIGINVYGPRWRHLYDLIVKWAPEAFDAEGFDMSVRTPFAEAYFKYCRAQFHNCGITDCDSIIRGLIYSCLHNLVVLDNVVYEMQWGVSSGHPFTSQLDTFVTCVVITQVYLMFCNQRDIEPMLKIAAYGDDNINRFSKEFKEKVTKGEFVKAVREHFGLMYTNADKTEVTDWNTGTTDFLSRNFVPVGETRCLCPLSIKSIFGMLLYVRSSDYNSPEEAIELNIQVALMEAYYHGEQFFGKLRKRLKRWSHEMGLRGDLTTYDEARQQALTHYGL